LKKIKIKKQILKGLGATGHDRPPKMHQDLKRKETLACLAFLFF